MRFGLQNSLPAVALLALGACSDPSGPCDRADACEVDGVDLAIEDVYVDWSADQPFHPAIDDHIVQPGDSMTLVVEVVNRGDEASEPRPTAIIQRALALNFTVPALEPGERHREEIRVVAPHWQGGKATYWVNFRETEENGGWVGWEGDADPANNSVYLTLHVAEPAFEMSIIEAPDTARILEPFQVRLRVQNVSPTTTAEEFVVAFCFYDFDLGCQQDWPGFSATPVPDWSLRPGEDVVIPLTVTMPSASSWLDEPLGGGLIACVMPAGSTLETLNVERVRLCDGGTPLLVLPNVEAACQPAPFVRGDTIAHASETGCENHGQSYIFRRIDAEAGEQFTVRVVSGQDAQISFLDRDGERLGGGEAVSTFTAPADGVYHVRVAGGGWVVALE